MREYGWLPGAFLILLVILVAWSPNTLWRFHSFGQQLSPVQDEIDLLRGENAYLKNQLMKNDDRVSGVEGIVANVYSHYPLNFKHELIIDKGTRGGVKEGAAVMAFLSGTERKPSSSGIFFVGTISKTTATKSFVKTVFDHNFKSAVRIGNQKTSGLFVGGLSPIITTLPKESKVSPGDIIVSAAPEMPYGAVIGRLREVRLSSDQLFREADIEFPYDINNLLKVVVESEI